MHILGTNGGEGSNFRLLGVLFDYALSMKDAVGELVCEVRWKLGAILRTGRFFTYKELVNLYTSKYCRTSNTEPLPYTTPAIMFWHHWMHFKRSFYVNLAYPIRTLFFISIWHRYNADEISRCLGSCVAVCSIRALNISRLSSQHRRRGAGTREAQTFGMDYS